MIELTEQQMKAAIRSDLGDKACKDFLPYLNKYMPKYGIDTVNRVAAFLAQILDESYELTKLTENLNYSADGLCKTWPNRFRGADGKPNEKALKLHRKPELIANSVYASRLGNGPEESGDGYKYRGRGLIMLTGKVNYDTFSKASGIDVLGRPDLLAVPEYAVISACWFWQTHGLSALADQWKIVEISKRVNGGSINTEDRIATSDHIKSILVPKNGLA